MIYTERKVSIKNDKATIDSPIILFRGDREVEIMFTIVDSKFKFESKKGNVIDKTQAAFGQLAVALPDGTDLFTEIVECENGVVVFSITGEMIDEIHEVGLYSFHIRLYNDDKTSRITLPPVMEGIEIREPLIIEGDVENTDLVGDATVGYSMVQAIGTDEEVFDEDGNYIPTLWGIGDKITAEKLNKMEEGLSTSVESAKYASDFIHDMTEQHNTSNVEFDGVEVGKVYLGESNTPSSLSSSFKTYYKSVSPGEVYTITTTTIGHVSYGAVQLYNDDGFVAVIEKNPEAVARTLTVTFTIPDNVNLMRSCVFDSVPVLSMSTTTYSTAAEFTENIYQSFFHYELHDSTLLVGCKAGADKDFYVELKNKGGNNLFDFSYFYQADNNTNVVDTSKPNFKGIGSAGGDWHGPFVVKALNNIDGDNFKEDTTYNQYFTGGNHQYNNQSDGSTRTAKQTSLRFIIDGREVTQGIGFARNIEIRWTNLIQGYNTTKSDGSGRAILQEDHVLKFDGDTWHSEVELVALEDLTIIKWYGFQAQIDMFANDFRYIGGTNRAIYVGDVNSDCGGNKAFTMIARGDEYCLRMELDVTYDIGAMETGYGAPYAFKNGVGYRKCYFYPVDNLTINKDEAYCLRGSYKFYVK